MKKIIFLGIAFSLFFGSQSVFAGNSSGCGVGSLIFKGKSGLFPNILAVTTNGTSASQTFGITSGTSGCKSSDSVRVETETQIFVADNYEILLNDAVRGSGEYVVAFSKMMGCEGVQTAFTEKLQGESLAIFQEQSSEKIIVGTQKMISADETLSKSCH